MTTISSVPIINPPMEYTGYIPGGFLPGSKVRIQGRVKPEANWFFINLVTGPCSAKDEIVFHIAVDFTQGHIRRASKPASGWNFIDKHGALEIYREESFEILISAERTGGFKIDINGKHFTYYFSSWMPLDRVTHLNIHGDTTISLIQFEKTPVALQGTYLQQGPNAAQRGLNDEHDYLGLLVAEKVRRISKLNPRIASKLSCHINKLLFEYEEKLFIGIDLE